MNSQFRPMMLGLFVAVFLTHSSFGQQAQQADSLASGEIVASSLGGTKNVHRRGNLFFAGQFNLEDMEAIKAQGFTRVITFRTDGEVKWDEEAALKAANMELIKIPFKAPESLTDEVFDQVRELLNDKSQPTLLHCSSANRVAGVWIPYRVLDEGADRETALQEANLIGLNKAFVKEKALDYVKRKQAQPRTDKEASAKPGINKKFIDPNLDVDSFVKRFEIESREIFVARERILAACGIKQGDTVADVGAGTGLFTRMFSTVVGDEGWVYAVDIAPRFIEHINGEAAKHKLNNITGVLCAENSINLPPNSTDVIFVCDTYHHFEYPKSTLASIKRALKKDGHFIMIDFERIEGKSREWLLGHVRAGKEVFRAEVLEAGFTLVEEVKIDGFEENYFLRFRKN